MGKVVLVLLRLLLMILLAPTPFEREKRLKEFHKAVREARDYPDRRGK